jgi:hypothetical protein
MAASCGGVRDQRLAAVARATFFQRTQQARAGTPETAMFSDQYVKA